MSGKRVSGWFYYTSVTITVIIATTYRDEHLDFVTKRSFERILREYMPSSKCDAIGHDF